MSRRLAKRAALLLAVAPTAVFAQAIAPGTSATFSLPGETLASGFYVDVPANAGALRIELEATTAGRDVDLLVRHGTPFVTGPAVDPDALFDQAQYRSVSVTGEEFVVITPGGVQPLAAGRWYLGVFNFDVAPSNVRVTATVSTEAPVVPIEVVYDDTSPDSEGTACDIGPWQNADRKAAMARAAELLTQQIRPIAPIRLQACWNSTDEDVLAYASAQNLFLHDIGWVNLPFLPDRYTWYASAAAAQRAGTNTCRFAGGDCDDVYDIRATFGSDANFHYGLDRLSPGGAANFISTAMHEITHGLGFFGLIDVETGERLTEFDDAYDNHARFFVQGQGTTPLLQLTDDQRAQALTSNNLRFGGENLVIANDGSSVKLYAPADPNPGSTLSHFDTITQRHELMAHAIPGSAPHDLGLALGVLYDIGWDPAPKAAPAFTVPDSGQYFDPARNGHGVGLYRVAGTENFYFAAFYTYGADGEPEFYVANGHVVDGIFVPERNPFGDSLVRSLYDPGQDPPTVHDSSPDFSGLVRIDFNAAANSPACRDGRSDRAPMAVMTFTLPGGDTDQWCMQPILEDPAVANDLTSIWYDPADPGWGASTLSFPGNGGDGLAVLLYFPDDAGNPRWALMQTDNYELGGTYPLREPVGYCRSCPLPGPQEFVEVGSITVSLSSVPGELVGTPPPNALTFDVDFGSGTFSRDSSVTAGGARND